MLTFAPESFNIYLYLLDKRVLRGLEGEKHWTSDSPDEELAAAYARGDEAAFARLVQRYLPLIRRQSRGFSVSAAEREDLVQEGLLGLFSAVRAFCPEKGEAFRPFALTCCKNRMRSHVRRLPDPVTCDPDGEESLNALPDGGMQDPVRRLLRREEAACLRDWLRDRLSEREYAVLMLFLDGYSYEEIARSCVLSVKAVDNALWRARRKIGRALIPQ